MPDLKRLAGEIADPAQYGWCESEGDGIKDPGIKQLQDDIYKALLRVREETIKEIEGTIRDWKPKYFPPGMGGKTDLIGLQLDVKNEILSLLESAVPGKEKKEEIMGLDIVGKKSKKSYHASYHGLHLVRELALRACGYPDGDWGFPSHYIIPKGLTGKILEQIVSSSIVCGHLYPNLMLHSDCEGTYTKTGEVLTGEGWLTGNSKGLLEELEDIKKSLPDKFKKERSWEIFKILYELVKDEVKNGSGHLEFC